MNLSLIIIIIKLRLPTFKGKGKHENNTFDINYVLFLFASKKKPLHNVLVLNFRMQSFNVSLRLKDLRAELKCSKLLHEGIKKDIVPAIKSEIKAFLKLTIFTKLFLDVCNAIVN